MKAVALTCNSCGAGLQLDEEVRFVTCNHCGSRLEIQRTNDAAYTKVLEIVDAVQRVADDTATEVETIKLERELEKLDASLREMGQPEGFGIVWFCGGFALFGLLIFLVADNNELRGPAIGLAVLGALAALYLGWGLREGLATDKAGRSNLHAQRDACQAKLRDMATRAVAGRRSDAQQ